MRMHPLLFVSPDGFIIIASCDVPFVMLDAAHLPRTHCLFSSDYNDPFAHRWHEQSDASVCVGKEKPATAVDILPTFPIYAKVYIE